jgi:RNA polymerase subunit RPABC4/transcription elongation factor Spt4
MNSTEAPQLPVSDKNLAACKRCHIVLTEAQYSTEGCRNCGGEKVDREEVERFTTKNFSGYVGVIDAERSWVARLIGCESAPTGVYAAHVADDDEDDDDEESEYEDEDDDGGAEDGGGALLAEAADVAPAPVADTLRLSAEDNELLNA